MKKSIAILLILTLAGFGLFAAVDNTKNDATIKISSTVENYSAFGVSTLEVKEDGFVSIANFQGAVESSVDTKVDMLTLHSFVPVGFLSGINNTTGAVNLTISIDKLASGNDNVAMLISPTTATIKASANSKFGTLKNTVITVKEATTGAAALAPAGTYSATVTIALVTA